MKSNLALRFLVVLCFFTSCKSIQLTPKKHAFPNPVDTSTKDINLQTKKTYEINDVHASNEFDGARLNDFKQINDTTYRATITPENEPINESAYFAFQIWSDSPKKIDLELYYPKHKHRYIPKLSYDAVNWTNMDTMLFDTLKGSELATLKLDIDSKKLYLVGQELQTSKHNKEWSKSLADNHSNVSLEYCGKSKLGRSLIFVDICEGSKMNKPAVAIIGRQHPPEVSGYFAMKSFIETILEDSPLSNKFREKYRILLYPMINPDGVDLGHWRHSAAGIDLNRDWGVYVQEETNAVVNHMTKTLRENKNKLMVGLDFHSTQKDVLYTFPEDEITNATGFKDLWVEALEDRNFNPNEKAYPLNQPISKAWFLLEHQAESITYEVGDETPRDYLREKARTGAKEMMKLLVFKN